MRERQPLASVSVKGQHGNAYRIDQPVTLIGRSSKNDIPLSGDRLVSRRHATLCFEQGKYILTDEDSANGTYINGIKIAPHRPYILRHGAELRIGSNILVFELHDVEMPRIEDIPTVILPVRGVMGSQADEARVAQPGAAAAWQLTSFSPRLIGIGSWNAFFIYLHRPDAAQQVRQDALRLLHEIEDDTEESADAGEVLVHPDMNLTIVPEGEGIFFHPRRITLNGMKDWQRATFRFYVKPEQEAKIRTCSIAFYAGPLLLGLLEVPLEFAGKELDIWPPAYENCIQMTTESLHTVYLAYSHEDEVIARAIHKALSTLDLPFLREVEALRREQQEGPALEQKLKSASIFQLFWSSNAARSAYMKQEWESALRLAGERAFLRPVYWEVPLVSPPEELRELHFTYIPANVL
ncbi:hypothetical protein KSD_22080 [Ktedonobacter sp. SOSP1-85]|uniref:FHA domain-containing protein n=1 Tax=Ktedonobacter sp. SOSP1-85 TaxID=2778367 RepID=UPI001914FA75|nr:FHA domain-containing protein [Ktedonobacter sp. SOSP1-85]GHO74437.1 hypothetical protein KSD_22080 [Ktedonobacter sp. SOSP1-85]